MLMKVFYQSIHSVWAIDVPTFHHEISYTGDSLNTTKGIEAIIMM